MINIPAATAAQVCDGAPLSAKAQELVTPQMSPDQYVSALEQNGLNEDACKFMVYGMGEKDSVCYATRSAQRVADPSNVADQEAIRAAQAWIRNPTAEAQQAAASAASKAGLRTSGAWAAQAAGWAKTPATASVAAPPDLSARAVLAAIQLAVVAPALRQGAVAQAKVSSAQQAAASAGSWSAISPPALPAPAVSTPTVPELTPAAAAQTNKAFQPNVDLGKRVADGTTGCV